MNTQKEKRRFPRIDHVTSQQILHLDDAQRPHRNFVITQDVSACGIRFNTNEKLEPATYFLIYLNEQMLQQVSPHADNWFRLGDYYLTRVAWVHEIKKNQYEVGAGFLEKASCNEDDLDMFTELVNLDMLDSLPDLNVLQ